MEDEMRVDNHEGLFPPSELDRVIESLGFMENYELSALRAAILKAYRAEDAEQFLNLYDRYQVLGQQLVESGPGDAVQGARTHAGLNVALARIWEMCGDTQRFYDALDDSIMQLQGLPGIDEETVLLEQITERDGNRE